MDGLRNDRGERPKFFCDAMLGSLARWLRFFGFDAAYGGPGMSDEALTEAARAEGRWLVTRNSRLAAAGPRSMLVRAESLDGQLVEVFSRLGLRPGASLESSRCGECNGVLAEVTAVEVSELIPPHVSASSPRFRRCAGCGRIYWPGSHATRIIERMKTVVGDLNI